MVCGGFACSKNALVALNVLYILVSFILIGVAAYAKAVAIVTSLSIVGGIIACGVFLLLISLIGLIGAVKHHQVLLFFYMIILFLLFLIQFAVACACLAITTQQQRTITQEAWKSANTWIKEKTQETFNCCGFDNQMLPITDPMGHPSCQTLSCCMNAQSNPICSGNITAGLQTDSPCSDCWTLLHTKIDKALKITGGIGLFFSFTEIIGVWLALRYRNQKDPRANPSAFL